ncbi:hypothetical protein G6045_16285 [Streptomyces sp. YC504]|uniref:Secreted protein n=1 Tax=Streptomyces mesophilus TaxID=1775132 RepID=A0A6G4XI13_9ACTN|nr:hypothetical protein [Streptomyces mesophilus]NGO77206.1 hypothetical protein [Streptomyces mesophilus]
MAALVTGATVLGAGSASAAGYRCTTSSKTIDHPGSTALSDDFDFKVTTCAKREGGYVYSKFTVDIDGPPGFSGYQVVNYDTRGLAQVKNSGSGTVVKSAYGSGLAGKMNNLNGYGNTIYTSPTAQYRPAAGYRYRGGSVLQIDWKDDGAGLRSYSFSASPTV